ncbi:TetR/AcrR family transcriptional regulator [Vallitalea okinawensis]|uniref:TetR/AcrR family transcriptional regulator n=1 Tax=Vallitalea okinawensis TaxID=2078660 RepID=UPI000CFB5EA8|nr:TetR/AcrR family transcriptional regulator [Vallitalea okinawensis]
MQYKKEEVRNAILEQAENEFLEKGFEKASIRSIAKSAGTTIGNFYNYFSSKEAIFDALVEAEYTKFVYFINHHNDIERPDYLWDSLDLDLCRKVLRDLINDFLPMFTDRLLLLVECSKGTKYENARELLHGYIKEHFIEHMEEHNSNYMMKTSFPSLVARQFLDGIVIILKDYKDMDERRNLIAEHILFYFIGTMGLLGHHN